MKVAGGGPSVHACAVFLRAESRDGDKFNQTPYAYPYADSLLALGTSEERAATGSRDDHI